jgi:hypothetical protein
LLTAGPILCCQWRVAGPFCHECRRYITTVVICLSILYFPCFFAYTNTGHDQASQPKCKYRRKVVRGWQRRGKKDASKARKASTTRKKNRSGPLSYRGETKGRVQKARPNKESVMKRNMKSGLCCYCRNEIRPRSSCLWLAWSRQRKALQARIVRVGHKSMVKSNKEGRDCHIDSTHAHSSIFDPSSLSLFPACTYYRHSKHHTIDGVPEKAAKHLILTSSRK